MSYVLGLNLSHDRSACIVRDGEIVVAIEEERLDRIKHSEGFQVQGHFERLTKSLPMRSVVYCLDSAGIGLDELDLVVGNRPLGDGAVHRIARELPIRDKSKIRALPCPSHHLAHACVTYYCSPFDNAAILVVDQAGSRLPNERDIEKHSLFVGEGTDIKLVATTTYPADYSDMSLGLFYDFFTVRLNFLTRYGTPTFGVFECGGYPEAGKTMGLAPYGRPRPDWGDWLHPDGFDVRVSQESLEATWSRLLAAEGQGYDPRRERSWQHGFAKDIARKAQDELERAMLHLVAQARERTSTPNLCLAGGITLNSVANQRIRTESDFDDVFIPGPSGDSGTAIGLALYGYHVLLGGTRRHPLRTAALGRIYPREHIQAAVARLGAGLTCCEVSVDEVAARLARHEVVGWFQGRSEMGPRALGRRSILADPRHPGMRDYLNEVVKHREPFRPYAPSVLVEHAESWFDMSYESPFMLLVPSVRQDKQAAVPAITHVDGTARVQTVRPDVDEVYHELIGCFHRRTGVPLLLNTSFNDAGEPIVETPEDALRTFLRTTIDHLYLDGLLVSKRETALHPEHPARSPLDE
ncbi:MAG TPA: carbamoyltransferase C-terminal domain-containing protein [Candidatus Dormibacteraeota bacterium]